MTEAKKKSYSKKPSKKERLAAELAQKAAKKQEQERVQSGGVFVRADGVAVRIVTNSLAISDEPLVSIGLERHQIALLNLGVDLYEMSSNRLKLDTTLKGLLGTTTDFLDIFSFGGIVFVMVIYYVPLAYLLTVVGLFVLINLLVDIAYSLLDPRIRLQGTATK